MPNHQVFNNLQSKKVFDRALENAQLWIGETKFYSGTQLFKVLLISALENSSIEDVVHEYKKKRGLIIPSGDTTMNSLDKEYQERSMKQIQDKIAKNIQDVAIRTLPHFTQKQYKRSKVTLAIDLHDEEYYGKHIFDKNGFQITMISPKTSKSGKRMKVFRTATVAIVKWGKKLNRPITIGFAINYKGQKREEILAQLLEQIDHLNLNIVFITLDGGFASKGVFNHLDTESTDFISRGRFSKKKKYSGKMNGPGFKYSMTGTRKNSINGYLASLPSPDGKDMKVLFLSSVKTSKTRIKKIYKFRFRIENTYRHARTVKIRTNTRKLHARWVFWGISLLLELIWELIAYIHERAGIPKYDYRQKSINRELKAVIEAYLGCLKKSFI